MRGDGKTVHDTPSRQKARELRIKAKAISKEAMALGNIIGQDAYPLGNLWIQASDLSKEADALKDQARLEDLTVRQEALVKKTEKGERTYYRWVASWREGQKTRHIYLGSTKKLSRAGALQKARTLKAEALRLQR